MLVVTGLTAWFTYLSIHAFSPNADGATVLLEGSALAHGHLLLNGWSLSLDSFWTVDVPFYALGVGVVGIQPVLMHLIPAALVALCLLVGVMLASSGQSTRNRVYAVTLLVLTLCLPNHAAAYFLLQGPWHVATTLYCLIAAYLLSRARVSWGWVVAVGLLALGLSGDLQMLAIGIVPIVLAGLVAMIRHRTIRAGATLISAAIVACFVALLIRIFATMLGTFRVAESHHTVTMQQLSRDIGHFGVWLTSIFGLNNSLLGGGVVPPVYLVTRLVIFVLVIFAICVAVVQLLIGVFRPKVPTDSESGSIELWRIDDLLLMMTAGAVALFLLLTLSDNVSYARYLDPVILFGSLLAARILPRLIERFSDQVEPMAAPLLAFALIVCGYASTVTAMAKTPAPPTTQLEHYLLAHDLTHGIGDYWASSIVTVDTRSQVVIRPVVANLAGKIVPDGRQATIDWYRGQHFQFLVYERKPYGRVGLRTVRATFGVPMNIHVIGRYFVVTYGHPLSLIGRPYP